MFVLIFINVSVTVFIGFFTFDFCIKKFADVLERKCSSVCHVGMTYIFVFLLLARLMLYTITS